MNWFAQRQDRGSQPPSAVGSLHRFFAPLARMRRMIARILTHPAFFWGTLLLAVACRIGWVLLIPSSPTMDAYYYFEGGRAIAQGQGFMLEGQPNCFWPVGYPAFLAGLYLLFGPSVTAAQLGNALLSVGTALFAYGIALKWFGSRVPARVAFVAMAFFPEQIFYTEILFSETCFLFFLMAAIFFWEWPSRGGRLADVACGIAFGLAAYVKSQAIFLPVFLGGLSAVVHRTHWRIAFKQTGLVCVTMLLVVLPWTARNLRLCHKFVLVSDNSGVNLFLGNNPHVRGNYSEDGLRESCDPGAEARRFIVSHPGEFFRRIPAKIAAMYLNQRGSPIDYVQVSIFPSRFSAGTVDRIVRNIQRKEDRRHFLACLQEDSTGWRRLRTDLPDEMRARFAHVLLYSLAYRYECNESRFLWLMQDMLVASRYAVLFLFALFSVTLFACPLRSRRDLLKKITPPLAVVAYFTCIYIVYFGCQRFSFPVMPFMIMCGALFFCWSLGLVRADASCSPGEQEPCCEGRGSVTGYGAGHDPVVKGIEAGV